MFNEDYYCTIYPEYKEKCALPLLHYVKYGWKEGANPSPLFNTTIYLAANEDILRLGISPLEHLATRVAAQESVPSLFAQVKDWEKLSKLVRSHLEDIMCYLAVRAGLFNEEYYLRTYPDVKEEASGLTHYRKNGWREKRRISSLVSPENFDESAGNPLFQLFEKDQEGLELIAALTDNELRMKCTAAGLFNADYYEFTYPEVAQYARDSFLHYMLYGWRLGYNPSPTFNTRWVQGKFPIINGNPVFYCVRHDICETFPLVTDFSLLDDLIKNQARDIVAWEVIKRGWFDANFYLDCYPDLSKEAINPWVHYHDHGIVENRIPSPYFQSEWYLDEYLDCDPRQCAIWHYFIQGEQKGCSACPNDEIQILKEESRLLLEQIRSLQNQLGASILREKETATKYAALQKQRSASDDAATWKKKYEGLQSVLRDMMGK